MANRCVIVVVVTVVVVLVVAAVVAALVVTLNKDDDAERNSYTAGNILKFFQESDGLDIVWYHRANSKATLKDAIDGNYQMVEADILLDWYGLPNQTDVPIMAHPPNITSDLTLEQFMEAFVDNSKKGAKLDFKSTDAVEPTMKILSDMNDDLKFPVWANADIFQGPNSDSHGRDGDKFIDAINEHFPDVTLSIGWTTGCCEETYTEAMIKTMWDFIEKKTTQPVTLPVRAALFPRGWTELKWILTKDLERYTITLWTVAGTSWEGLDPYDLLLVRNDIPKTNIFYDLEEIDKMTLFRRLCVTAGNPINHFLDVNNVRWDAAYVRWRSAINKKNELQDVENAKAVVQGDVMKGMLTDSSSETLIMGVSTDQTYDVTFSEWLTTLQQTGNAIQVTIEEDDIVTEVINELKSQQSKFKQPVWIQANVFEGPNAPANTTVVNGMTLISQIEQLYKEVTVCLGWVTGPLQDGTAVYTEDMINEMAALATQTKLPVVFEFKAEYSKKSLDNIVKLLDKSMFYSVLISSSTAEDISVEDLLHIRNNAKDYYARIFYNLPKNVHDDFLSKF